MSEAPAWMLDDVAAMVVEANAELPLPLCDFTPEEEDKLAAIEAAPAAPESYACHRNQETRGCSWMWCPRLTHSPAKPCALPGSTDSR